MDEQQEPQATAEPEQPPRSGKPGAVWVVIGVVVVIAICVIALVARPDTSGDPEHGAKVACRDFVKKRLKAPSTADFSGEQVAVNGTTYSVTGNVDAENSFGAKLRSTYTCVVQDAGDEWRLTSLTGV